MATVFFKGLCLFHTHGTGDARDVEVLLPDASGIFYPRDQQGEGIPHEAIAWVRKAKAKRDEEPHHERHPLTEAVDVSFIRGSSTATGPVGNARALKDLPSFECFAPRVRVGGPDRIRTYAAARIRLGGGKIVPEPTPAHPSGSSFRGWTFTKLPPGKGSPPPQSQMPSLAYWANWESNGATKISIGGEVCDLSGDVIITNLPVGSDPFCDPVWTSSKYTQDHHFRWYYSLLEDKTSGPSLDTQLAKALKGSPVPTVTALNPTGHTQGKPPPVQPTVPIADEYPTCFCAECGDGDDDDFSGQGGEDV